MTDKKTGLMWVEKSSYSRFSVADAGAYCAKFNGGGYNDWRLPTKGELEELFYAGVRSSDTSGDYIISIDGAVHYADSLNGEPYYFETQSLGQKTII